MKKNKSFAVCAAAFAIACSVGASDAYQDFTHTLPAENYAQPSDTGANKLRIYQIDTDGNIGDIYLIIAPDGQTSLVDTGYGATPQRDYAVDVLFPALKKHQVKHIDRVVISHPHEDHMGALAALLENPDFEVSSVCWTPIPLKTLKEWEPDDPGSLKRCQEALEAIEKNKIPVVELQTGDKIPFGKDVTGKVLITARLDENLPSYNENSMVFQLRYGDFTMLFTGDMGFYEEGLLLATKQDIKSDVLKSGHHAGAGAGSPAFLDAVDPVITVSCMPQWLSERKELSDLITTEYAKRKLPFFRSWEYPDFAIFSDGKSFQLQNVKK